MRQTLVIGSTAVDVLLNVDQLPRRSCDVNIKSQHLAIGGCAFNMAEILRLYKIPYTLCSPVGTGMYGAYVENIFSQRNIPVFEHIAGKENGCCYCIIEEDGERTFLSNHGAEYCFQKSWMDKIDEKSADSVYISGLEVEEPTGIEIVEYLESHPDYKIFFATGPRISYIDKDLVKRIFDLHPIIHLNEMESLEYTGESSVEQAAIVLNSRTKNDVVITLGGRGAYCFSNGHGVEIPGFPTKPVSTVGAGDAHIGAVIANLKRGLSIQNAVSKANYIAAATVSVEGATLTDDVFNKLENLL